MPVPVPAASVAAGTPSINMGIHALEVYVPRHCASAASLERAHKVEGKYTVGLMMREWAVCDEDEDVARDDACRASMIGATADASALTAGVHTTPASFRDSGSTARWCSIPRIVTSSCVLFDMARCRE